MLPMNEGCDGTAFWGTTGVPPAAGVGETWFASSVLSASLGMPFTVATADASDMDFGRKAGPIGKRVNSSGLCLESLPQRSPTTSCLIFSLVYKLAGCIRVPASKIFCTTITKYT